MLHQYLATHDIKFPDQRQYMKPGDQLMYNDTHQTMTVYRDSNLIGTVHFSKSALQEFQHLGWIKNPVEKNADEPVYILGIDTGFEESKAVLTEVAFTADGTAEILSHREIGPDEEAPTEMITIKSRKPKKS